MFMVAHQMSWQIVFPCDIISMWSFLICWITFWWLTVTDQWAYSIHSWWYQSYQCNRSTKLSFKLKTDRKLHCQSAGWNWQSADRANICLQLAGWRVLLSSAAANTSDSNACHQTVPTAGSALKPTFHLSHHHTVDYCGARHYCVHQQCMADSSHSGEQRRGSRDRREGDRSFCSTGTTVSLSILNREETPYGGKST